MAEAMIQADGLVKIYKSKQTEVLALQEIGRASCRERV